MKLRELLAEEIDKKVLTASKECDFSAISRGICALNIGPRKMSRLLNEIYVEYNKSGALIACDLLDERVDGLVNALEELKIWHKHMPGLSHTRAMGDNYGWCDYCNTKVSWGPCVAEEALEKFKKGMGR